MRRSPLWLLAIAVLGAALVLGCNEEKKDSTNQDNTPQATSADTTPADGADGGDTNSELSDLAEQFVSKPVKASYTYSSSSGGQTSDGVLTLYTNPPDWRLDFSSPDGGTSIILKNADGSFICTESECIASPSGSTIPFPFFGFLNDPSTFADTVTGSFAGVDVDRSDATIAGQDGKCYSVTSSITGAEATTEYCFTEEGLLLRAKVSAGGAEFSIEATSIETSVDPADLQPPYPVTEIPGQ